MRQHARQSASQETPPAIPAGMLIASDSAGRAPRNGFDVDREEIAKLAHQYWLERGAPHGSADQDWLRAEAELRALTAVTRESAKVAALRSQRASAGN